MPEQLIFWPMIAQAALTAFAWFAMYAARIREMRGRHIDPQSVSTSRSASLLQNVATADNFRNLFEVPVLFFAICLALAISGAVSDLQLTLAWTFVLLRAAHTAIHISYNRVMHRFIVHALGTLCVFVMWALLAVDLARG